VVAVNVQPFGPLYCKLSHLALTLCRKRNGGTLWRRKILGVSRKIKKKKTCRRRTLSAGNKMGYMHTMGKLVGMVSCHLATDNGNYGNTSASPGLPFRRNLYHAGRSYFTAKLIRSVIQLLGPVTFQG